MSTPSAAQSSASIPAAARTCPPPAGDQQLWFTEQVQGHESQLKAYLRRAFPSLHDVDDFIQESYLRIWKRRLLGPIASTKSFLYKVARNLAIDDLRRRHRSPVDPHAELDPASVAASSPDAAEATCQHDEFEILLAAIEALPSRCRQVLILRQLRGQSTKQIAARLGICERTVELHGAKGVRRCDEYLRRHGVAKGRQ